MSEELTNVIARAKQLCEWIGQTPHQRGSINGLATQVRNELTSLTQRPAAQPDLTVRVCPLKDAVCGDRSDSWCDKCPKRPAAQAGERDAPYGYCPECGAPGVMRERKPDGDDKCSNGHRYPSRSARASLPTQPAAQTDSMGMPTSCGKPLCSPDKHHPLCKLHQPAAQATPEPGLLKTFLSEADRAGVTHLPATFATDLAAATPEPVGDQDGQIDPDCRRWLEGQRIDGGPHGFEAAGVEALSRMWRAARASNQAEPVGEYVTTYSSESIGGKQHDTGRVNKGPRGSYFASTASPEDARLIADALNAYTHAAQPMPMTDEQRDDLAVTITTLSASESRKQMVLRAIDWVEAHFGITAQAKGAGHG